MNSPDSGIPCDSLRWEIALARKPCGVPLLAAAHGAIDAYKELTGEDWKAYEAPAEAQVEKKAATAQMGAFGG